MDRPEFKLWANESIDTDVTVAGKVVYGFQRGSKQLGIPTANIEMTEENLKILESSVPGVYMAYCVHPNGRQYKAAVSIGYNPVFDNKVKTLETHVISDEVFNDFYGEHMTVHLRRYIRPEALFDDFDSLIIAISCDLQATIDTEF